MENYTCETCAGEVCLNKLKSAAFSTLSFESKVKLISKERSVPGLDKFDLTQRKGNFTRYFNKKFYDQYYWLTGCVHTQTH